MSNFDFCSFVPGALVYAVELGAGIKRKCRISQRFGEISQWRWSRQQERVGAGIRSRRSFGTRFSFAILAATELWSNNFGGLGFRRLRNGASRIFAEISTLDGKHNFGCDSLVDFGCDSL